jgi:hypothetical protein
LFIFLEAFGDLFVTAEPLLNRYRAPKSMFSRWKLHRRASEYTTSHAHRPTPVPYASSGFTAGNLNTFIEFIN